MRKMSDKIEKNIVSVDEDILKFLKAAYFGDFSDCYKAACNRAYRDMNRTIRFGELSSNDREDLKKEVKEKLKDEIKDNLNKISSQEEFDDWHEKVCDQIKEIYKEKGITLTYGQAQKWINMTIKYLYVLEAKTFDGVFEYLHVPIDNYVLDIAKEELGVERIKEAWSKLDVYEEYLKYQENIKEKIGEIAPLRWEFRNWLKAAKNIS